MASTRPAKKNAARRTSGPRPARAAGAILAVAAVAFTAACTNAPNVVGTPSRVLQSVNVGLASNGSIWAVNGTAISVDDTTGDSSSADTSYVPGEVASDLPVRVSAQYRTAEKTGTNLEELAGYTGRIEIGLTVENLTVAPRDVTFDVAGQSRTEPALVGAPMTIAASTVLPGVSPGNIVGESGSGSAGTNGIISASPEGEAVIQWATLLAPPATGASTTLRLVADVTDFVAPGIDVAVQPGMSTDLSVDGVLASAFDTSPTSELALQRRTIDLIAEVNDVLSRAGSTITDVRGNLESTSKTLGVSTAAHLKESSDSLAGTLSGLKDQLGSLKTDLDTTVTGAETTTLAQLSQTVNTVDAMLGDTSVGVPKATIKGNGCAAIVAPAGETATVYSSLVLMSAQLDGYARSTAGCRDEVATALQKTVGPAQPNAENCTEASLTCAFHASSITVTGALLKLVGQGDKLVATLQPEVITGARAQHRILSDGIDELAIDVEALDEAAATGDASKEQEAKATKVALQELRDTVKNVAFPVDELKTAIDKLVADERTRNEKINTIASDTIKLVEDHKFPMDLENPWVFEPSEHTDELDLMTKQNDRLAAEMCALIPKGVATGSTSSKTLTDESPSREDIEELRSYLTSIPCSGTDPETFEALATDSKPLHERMQNLADDLDGEASDQAREWTNWADNEASTWDARIERHAATQIAAWKDVEQLASKPVLDGPAYVKIDEANASLSKSLEAVNTKVKELDGTLKGSDSLRGEIESLRKTVNAAKASRNSMGAALLTLQKQQDELESGITKAFEDTQAAMTDEVTALIDSQIRVVSAQGAEGSDAVVKAFDRSVAGLSSTAADVEVNAKTTVDKQHAELAKQDAGLSEAVSRQTAASLEEIARSTGASTRDVEGASKLLASGLSKVMLDLGDRKVNGSGLLGSMATSAAKADTADYQLALATKNAQGYANVRAEDVAGILLRQAQFKASLETVSALPTFHLEVPAGAATQTLYSFRLGSAK
ncbi:hypothetical protein [Paeniglutamicibacter psychrophenolicus]|uniref:hypothetical protein n=1 Tax=Paeniglutamicibacter psychrophenolicus TaxID=257454 RepID=UPI00277FDFA0|nr:hypothetical protein [Paeniglutamicibacter psychrophenolicus]MDQ0093800.1 putative nucleic acid-binding Zn-ribbon protein [Paeniglutamicibacter psychrophenolicus]